ncbi:MAG: hypothetical protein ABWZ43_10475 [Solirubrobacterales bacterium]
MEYVSMTEEHKTEPEGDDSPGSVFGNLPDSRPGSRSPRRRSGKGGGAAKAKAKPAAKAKPKRAAKPKAAPRPRAAPKPPPSAPPEREREPAAAASGGGLEDLAWAGVAAAAEAATLGVRLASRAIESLRGNSEERD